MIHARWAMLGALGCVTTELIGKSNPDFPAGARLGRMLQTGRLLLGRVALLRARCRARHAAFRKPR